MQVFINIFLLTGVILGIALNFAPELFSGVAIKGSPAPVLSQGHVSPPNPTHNEVSEVVNNLTQPLTKVVNIYINEQHFSVSLDSIDKKTIIDTARKLCITHASTLNIRPEDVDAGCVGAVADHIIKDVFSGPLTQYPVSVTVPINEIGAFDLQFDLMQTTPHEVALSFCQGKRAEFNIATEELLLTTCVPSVEQFIVGDLKARGVLDAEPAAAAPVSREPVNTPQVVQEVPEHVASVVSETEIADAVVGSHIPFTQEEEAALKAAEDEIAHHHHDTPPADVSAPV